MLLRSLQFTFRQLVRKRVAEFIKKLAKAARLPHLAVLPREAWVESDHCNNDSQTGFRGGRKRAVLIPGENGYGPRYHMYRSNFKKFS